MNQKLETAVKSVTITLPNDTKLDTYEWTAIDEGNLSEEFARHASLLYYISNLVAEAEAEYEAVKLDREIMFAELDVELRVEFESQDKKYTEAKIKNLVLHNDGYREILDEEGEAYALWKQLRALADAMRVRGDMLISLGANLRAEANLTGAVINEYKEQRS